MVYFHTKNANFGIFSDENFWCIPCPFDIVITILVFLHIAIVVFLPFWCILWPFDNFGIFTHFGLFYQETPGSPDRDI
jgi:hypothetical protein